MLQVTGKNQFIKKEKHFVRSFGSVATQLTLTCSKSTLESAVKYVAKLKVH